MKCVVCNIHKATIKDYRFITSLGMQGSVRSCDYCYSLNDDTIIKVHSNEEDPKKYYSKKKKETK